MMQGPRYTAVAASSILAAAALLAAAGHAPAAGDAAASVPPAAPPDAAEQTEAESRIVAFAADWVAAGKSPDDLTVRTLSSSTGVPPETILAMDQDKLREAVVAELRARGILGDDSCSGGCSRFSACSVDHNLNFATGEELARYEKEKAMDGATEEAWVAPEFTLPTTDGGRISLKDLRGRPVALVLLSGHCRHSLDTLGILAELDGAYRSRDLAILPVFVNSGEVADVAALARSLGVKLALAVSKGKEISRAYDSRMVPTEFLIDRSGRVRNRLVGFKDRASLVQAYDALVGERSEREAATRR